MRTALTLLFFFALFRSQAQEPRLVFLSDTVAVGEELLVSLAFDHLPEAEVQFPKEAGLFRPFELVGYYTTPTSTYQGLSTDSLVYRLKTFSTTPLQSLLLPIWIQSHDDSTKYESNSDSIHIIQLVSAAGLRSAKLMSSTGLLSRKKNTSFGFWQKSLLGGLLLLSGLYLFFRKQIDRMIKRQRFLNIHRRFRFNFKRFILGESNAENLESANKLWRNHMEWLEQKPYSSLSLAEIDSLNQNEQLTEAMRELENSLYGGLKSEQLHFALQILFAFANEKFKLRYLQFKRDLKRGKYAKSGTNSGSRAVGKTGS